MKLKRFLTGVLSAVMALSVCALPAAAAGGDASTTTTKYTTSTINKSKKVLSRLISALGQQRIRRNQPERVKLLLTPEEIRWKM